MRAVIRCIADLVLRGYSKEETMSVDFGAHITEHVWGEARMWLYKDSHGKPQRHRPLRQPFPYKELVWDSERKTLETVARDSAPTDVTPEPRTMTNGDVDPESLRVSHLTFNLLFNGTVQPRADRYQDHEPTKTIREPPSPTEPVEVMSATQPATLSYSLVMRSRPQETPRGSSSSNQYFLKAAMTCVAFSSSRETMT